MHRRKDKNIKVLECCGRIPGAAFQTSLAIQPQARDLRCEFVLQVAVPVNTEFRVRRSLANAREGVDQDRVTLGGHQAPDGTEPDPRPASARGSGMSQKRRQRNTVQDHGTLCGGITQAVFQTLADEVAHKTTWLVSGFTQRK